MDIALTLLSVASFFGLIVGWTVLPASQDSTATATSHAAAQAAH
jgi:hypothetical protein